jgi:glc operon protein GlcG
MSRKFLWAAAITAAVLFTANGAMAGLADVVVQGAAAKKIQESTELSLAAAKKMAAACEAFAARNHASAAITILDKFGQQVYFERTDGAFGPTQLVASNRKAKTALITRRTSHEELNRVLRGQTTEFHEGFYNDVFAVPGGLAITMEDQFLGAIGVGGSIDDEGCARAGLDAIGAVQPPAADKLPRRYAPSVSGGG